MVETWGPGGWRDDDVRQVRQVECLLSADAPAVGRPGRLVGGDTAGGWSWDRHRTFREPAED